MDILEHMIVGKGAGVHQSANSEGGVRGLEPNYHFDDKCFVKGNISRLRTQRGGLLPII